DGRSRRAQRFRRRARDPHAHPAADADQLRRIEPRSRQSGDGGDGTGRGNVSAAHDPAAARVARETPQSPEGPPPVEGRARVTLEADITTLAGQGASAHREAVRDAFARLREALSAGEVRAAEPDPASPAGWRVNAWVKQGILLGFKFGDVVDMSLTHVERR